MRKLLGIFFFLSFLIFTSAELFSNTTNSAETVSGTEPEPVNQTNAPPFVPEKMSHITNYSEYYTPPFFSEEIFALSIDLMDSGYSRDALFGLRYVFEKGETNTYVYEKLLDAYIQVLSSSYDQEAPVQEALYYSRIGTDIFPTQQNILYKCSEIQSMLLDMKQLKTTLQLMLSNDIYDNYANYYMGLHHFQSNEYRLASEYFRRAVAIRPTKNTHYLSAVYMSYQYLGMIEATSRRYPQSTTYLEKAIEIGGKNGLINSILAFNYAKTLDFEKASRTYEEMSGQNLTLSILNFYAGCLLMMDETNQINELFNQYGEQSQYIHALNDYQAGNYTQSLNGVRNMMTNQIEQYNFYNHALIYLNALELNDTNLIIEKAYLLGEYSRDMGRLNLAVTYFKKIRSIEGDSPDIIWLLADAYDMLHRYQTAANLYENYLTYQNVQYRVLGMLRLSLMYANLGMRQEENKRLIQAKRIAEETNEDLYLAYLYSGSSGMRNKNYDSAIIDFEYALKLSQKDQDVYFSLATAYFNKDEFDKSLETLEKAMEQGYKTPDILNLAAYILAVQQKELERALGYIQAALTEDPENIAYIDTLGWIQFQLGQYTASLRSFESLLRILNEEDYFLEGMEEVYYHAAVVFHKNGLVEQAEKHIERISKIDPESGWLKKNYRNP